MNASSTSGHTEPLGDPGGSDHIGRIGVDTELVGGRPTAQEPTT
ncbi:MAG TPA: hypothetical protein VGL80_24630 [Pseudonocardiaceae bacterium]